ncbi:MAG: phosphatidate cytidylyltransferase [Rhodospirillales bacterium]|nr:phosphatidate cytidylyltransferase [Rhodospirillales bacterium]
MAPPRPENLTRQNPLVARSLSAIALAIPVLAVVHYGSPYFEIMIVIASILMTWEWCRLCSKTLSVVVMVALGLSVAAAIVAVEWSGWTGAFAILVVAALGLYGATGRQAWLGGGAVYIGLPCVALVWLRGDEIGGRDLILWLLVVVWASDIGAYAVGRLVGGPRLAPKISPKKTWSGLIGGLASAAAVGATAALVFEAPDVLSVAAISVILGALAQMGDLFESAVKRRFGVKDSSNLIPGHGGLLDRVDGLMAASVALALIVAIEGGSIRQWV